MTRRPALRDHAAFVIMERAAAVLAEHGDAVSMAEIAEAADVGRATLYRYFATRDALLQAMAETALDELTERLAQAQLDSVAVPEAVARAARAFVATGGKYIALTRSGHKPADPGEADERIGEPLRALFRRGIDSGVLRADLPVDVLLVMFSGLIEAGIGLSAHRGAEQASSAITAIFLNGAAQTG